jgi:hypothetical protein
MAAGILSSTLEKLISILARVLLTLMQGRINEPGSPDGSKQLI